MEDAPCRGSRHVAVHAGFAEAVEAFGVRLSIAYWVSEVRPTLLGDQPRNSKGNGFGGRASARIGSERRTDQGRSEVSRYDAKAGSWLPNPGSFLFAHCQRNLMHLLKDAAEMVLAKLWFSGSHCYDG
jgi:hypothetical protein